MILKKYVPYFCVLPCHKYALTFIKMQGKNAGKNAKFNCNPGCGSRLKIHEQVNEVQISIFER